MCHACRVAQLVSEVHHIQHMSRRISRVPSSFWKHALLVHSARRALLPAALQTALQASAALPPSSQQPSEQDSHDHPSQHASGRRDLPAYKRAQRAVHDTPSEHSLEERLSSMHTPGKSSRAADGHPQQSARQTIGRRLQSSTHADTMAVQHSACVRTRPMSQSTDHALGEGARDGRQATAQVREVRRSTPEKGAAAAIQEHGSRVGASTARSRIKSQGRVQLEHVLQMPESSHSSHSMHSMRMSLQSPPQGRPR